MDSTRVAPPDDPDLVRPGAAVTPPAEFSDLVRLDLDSTMRAPCQARRAVREVLLAWRLPALVDVVVLATSELVTNAVRHGRPPVHLVLRRTPDQVNLDLHDGEPGEPSRSGAAVGGSAESGRGLDIVRALGADLTCEQVQDNGKVVHASFGVVPDA